ncbi:MAG: hypothetical protein GXO68_05705 [Crenarchaeota archaeon]|nr:hypothetical protein [Thermoproteota archaeon]
MGKEDALLVIGITGLIMLVLGFLLGAYGLYHVINYLISLLPPDVQEKAQDMLGGLALFVIGYFLMEIVDNEMKKGDRSG